MVDYIFNAIEDIVAPKGYCCFTDEERNALAYKIALSFLLIKKLIEKIFKWVIACGCFYIFIRIIMLLSK